MECKQHCVERGLCRVEMDELWTPAAASIIAQTFPNLVKILSFTLMKNMCDSEVHTVKTQNDGPFPLHF